MFCFACGWLIDKTLGWVKGGRVIFAVVVAVVFITVIMVSLFSDYFGIENLLTENLILYSLRNIMLGAMAFFGLTVAELLILQKQVSVKDGNRIITEIRDEDAKKRARLLVEEATLKADKTTFEAKKELASLTERKQHVESQLRELIEVEKEMIRKYEAEEEN